MVGKRNRILQTKKHQDTGGDHVCEMRFLAKKYVFQKKMKFIVKNMLTGNGKNAILSELLGTNCF
mgnify:CR=1 FL=1